MTSKRYGWDTGEFEQVALKNIDRMGSADPKTRAIARLNRDIGSFMDTWLHDDALRVVHPADVFEASVHGILSVAGTILINQEKDRREAAAAAMKEMLDAMWDEMAAAAASFISEA